jgi:hypothetical protein
MSNLNAQAEAAVASLIESDESQLYEQLGIRARAIEQNPAVAGSFDPPVTFDAAAMGPIEDIRNLGIRIFRRWEKEAYGLACGKSADEAADRKAIGEAFGIGVTAVAALITTALVNAFGLAPAIAAVIAAIIVKRFFRPAYQEFCEFWGERLSAEASS